MLRRVRGSRGEAALVWVSTTSEGAGRGRLCCGDTPTFYYLEDFLDGSVSGEKRLPASGLGDGESGCQCSGAKLGTAVRGPPPFSVPLSARPPPPGWVCEPRAALMHLTLK